jgi:putative redox protein
MEKHISLAWGEGLEFTATSDEGVDVPMGGAESPGTLRPATLLLAALGGCTGMDVVSILAKKRVEVTSYRIEVRGAQAEEAPKPFTSIVVEHIVAGRAMDDAAVARAVELSARRYCTVGATIALGETTISHQARILDEKGERTCECLTIGPRGQGLG